MEFGVLGALPSIVWRHSVSNRLVEGARTCQSPPVFRITPGANVHEGRTRGLEKLGTKNKFTSMLFWYPLSADFDLCFKNRPLSSQSSANWRCRAEAVRAEAQGVDRILLSKTRFGSLMPECMNPSRTRTSESGAKSSSTKNENYIACFWYSPYSLTSTTAPRAVKSSSANKVFPCCSISPPRRTPLTSEGALSQALADGIVALSHTYV